MNVGRESPVSGHRHINQQLGTEIGMDIGPKKKEEEEIRKNVKEIRIIRQISFNKRITIYIYKYLNFDLFIKMTKQS